MPAPRKPKKIFVQFAVALVIAAVLGIGALVIGFSIISNVSSTAELAKKEAAKKEAEAEAKLEELRRQQAQQQANQSAPMTYKIVQTLADLKPGEPVNKDALTLIETQERPIPGTITQLSQAVGKIVKAPVMAGETLDMSKLLDTGSMLNVEQGMRAITIQVDAVAGLNGALSPGMRVDVLATITRESDALTRTLLQNIQIISVNSGMSAMASAASGVKGAPAPAMPSGGSGGGNSVTLAVTPKQAELLTLANQMSSLHLTLRNYGDKRVAPLAGADITALISGIQQDSLNRKLPKPPVLNQQSGFHNVNYSPEGALPDPNTAPAAKPKFSMQIYRGTGPETVDFEQ